MWSELTAALRLCRHGRSPATLQPTRRQPITSPSPLLSRSSTQQPQHSPRSHRSSNMHRIFGKAKPKVAGPTLDDASASVRQPTDETIRSHAASVPAAIGRRLNGHAESERPHAEHVEPGVTAQLLGVGQRFGDPSAHSPSFSPSIFFAPPLRFASLCRRWRSAAARWTAS